MADFRKWLWAVLLAVVLFAVATPTFADELTPERFVIGAGAGITNADQPSPQGWMTMCTKIADGTFACTALDILSLKTPTPGANMTSFRAGVERVLFRQGPAVFTAKADAGFGTIGGNVGGSYGAGGSLLLKIPKTQGLYGVGSFTLLKSTVGDLSPEFVIRFGVAYAFGH